MLLWLAFKTRKRMFLHPKLSSMPKPHSIYQKILIDMTWESGGSINPPEVIEHRRGSPTLNVFSDRFEKNVFGPISFVETTVADVAYVDMADESFMFVFEE
jgi:hypothetical protein